MMSTNDKKNWQVFVAAFALTLLLSVLWLAVGTADDESIRASLRYSAQLAFALYLVVLVARPLQQLLRKDWTALLLRNRRLVGVAFAAVMTAHLGLIAWRFGSQPELEFSFPFVGATAYLIFYLMLITSFDGPRKAMSLKAWKFLHRTGLVVAAFIFGLPRSLDDLSDPDYLKFGIPFAIALLIRVIAWQQSRRRDS
jgi:DMSO/TMAO reductase YedYZ heme-binding membrane subunit